MSFSVFFFCLQVRFSISLLHSLLSLCFYSKLLVRVQRRPRRRERARRCRSSSSSAARLRRCRLLGPPLPRPRLFLRRRRLVSAAVAAPSSSAPSGSGGPLLPLVSRRRPQSQLRRRRSSSSSLRRGSSKSSGPLVLRLPAGSPLQVAPLVLEVDLRAARVEPAPSCGEDERPAARAVDPDELAEAVDLVVGPEGRGPALAATEGQGSGGGGAVVAGVAVAGRGRGAHFGGCSGDRKSVV